MVDVVISGTGIYSPPDGVTNDELVEAFNGYVEDYNTANADAINIGAITALQPSSAAFIEKASGIKHRYVMDKAGITNKDLMSQQMPSDVHGDDDTPCLQAQLALGAAKMALDNAGLKGEDIDYIVCSASTLQRQFPAIGIEVQHHLGAKGTAIDMMMACSSATFGIIGCIEAVQSGRAKRAMMINPEIFSTLVNPKDRDSHFIFGDTAVAVIVEAADICKAPSQWKILDTKSMTQYSNNIRTHFGPLTRLEEGDQTNRRDQFFMQEGRKVFKELLPLVTSFLREQMSDIGIDVTALKRMWLHQANINMNMFAAKKLLGREPEFLEAPTVLDEFGNTAGAGSIIAFHKYHDDFVSGEKGLICSFGAGYSIGSLIVEKI